uniref:Uncharacterized protein n=1 Tax=Rhipicephalus microplus TaxID=6941 RepID=A0A6G5AF76_RHIMP
MWVQHYLVYLETQCLGRTSSSQFFNLRIVPETTEHKASRMWTRNQEGTTRKHRRTFPWSPGNCQETPHSENGCFFKQTCCKRVFTEDP